MTGLTPKEQTVMDLWDAGERSIRTICAQTGQSEARVRAIVTTFHIDPTAEDQSLAKAMLRSSALLLNALQAEGFV